ncbi:hypothetical protein B4064_1269 [Caldibacillus thermoamylovorans]|nr:hypothetical protein B4064_1269 [Caldibacillus thermoamylovorans]
MSSFTRKTRTAKHSLFKKVEKYKCRKMNSVENVELFITDEGKELLLHFYEREEK